MINPDDEFQYRTKGLLLLVLSITIAMPLLRKHVYSCVSSRISSQFPVIKQRGARINRFRIKKKFYRGINLVYRRINLSSE